MGRLKHDAVIVTSWDNKYIMEPHAKAIELFGSLVSDCMPGVVNGQASFFIAPDGSKEGWNESDDHDDKRKEFLDWMKELNSFCDYAWIRFGGDDDQTAVYTGQYQERG